MNALRKVTIDSRPSVSTFLSSDLVRLDLKLLHDYRYSLTDRQFKNPTRHTICNLCLVIYSGVKLKCFKDGAYYCYCAYVLRISRYSDFLLLTLTYTGIFLRGLKLCGESRS